VTALRPPRHRHSPRIRRRARDWGVELGDVVGTGPAGRVTEDDLRAATALAAPVAPAAGGIAAVQVVVPPRRANDRAALLAEVAVAVLAALRRRGVAATALGLTTLERTAVVSDAHDLTADALRRRLAGVPPDAPCDVRVVDARDVDAQVGLPRPGERAVLAVGAVREGVAVERTGDGMVAFVVRATVTMTVATAPQLPESVSAEVLQNVARALA